MRFQNGFIKRFVGIFERTEKVLVTTNYPDVVVDRSITRNVERYSDRTIYLYAVLRIPSITYR